MPELVQLITTGGAIVVLTWVVWELVNPNGKLSARREVTEKDARIARLETRLDRALASTERLAETAEPIAQAAIEAKRVRRSS